MHSPSYVLSQLAELGINTPTTKAARKKLDSAPVVPADFFDTTCRLRAELVAEIAAGKVTADELVSRVATLDTRASHNIGAIVNEARDLIGYEVTAMLAADGAQVDKAILARGRQLRDEVAKATATLDDAKVDSSVEAMGRGPAVATAWAVREASRDALAALRRTRDTLVAAGILTEEPAGFVDRAREAVAPSGVM